MVWERLVEAAALIVCLITIWDRINVAKEAASSGERAVLIYHKAYMIGLRRILRKLDVRIGRPFSLRSANWSLQISLIYSLLFFSIAWVIYGDTNKVGFDYIPSIELLHLRASFGVGLLSLAIISYLATARINKAMRENDVRSSIVYSLAISLADGVICAVMLLLTGTEPSASLWGGVCVSIFVLLIIVLGYFVEQQSPGEDTLKFVTTQLLPTGIAGAATTTLAVSLATWHLDNAAVGILYFLAMAIAVGLVTRINEQSIRDAAQVDGQPNYLGYLSLPTILIITALVIGLISWFQGNAATADIAVQIVLFFLLLPFLNAVFDFSSLGVSR